MALPNIAGGTIALRVFLAENGYRAARSGSWPTTIAPQPAVGIFTAPASLGSVALIRPFRLRPRSASTLHRSIAASCGRSWRG
jgi:hypothetical protein